MSEMGQNRKYSLRADVFRSCTDGERYENDTARQRSLAAIVGLFRRKRSRSNAEPQLLGIPRRDA
jgi:hypothetical protein